MRRSLAFCFSLVIAHSLFAADWPQYRHDANRSAASPEQLEAKLYLQWTRDCDEPKPAWPEESRLLFDASLEPIVSGKTVILASARTDSITAIDTATGEEKWRFFAEGPVRFAPVARDSRIYFGADDGFFYCLGLSSGELVWRFEAAPSSRKVIGNDRLSSVWPVRGGPVFANGEIHFTVGVWPFEGTFLYSIPVGERAAGKSGPKHKITTLSSAAPQGYLAADQGKLFIPCGRANAECRDLVTGRTVKLSYSAKGATDYHAIADGSRLFHGGKIYELNTKSTMPVSASRPVTFGDEIYVSQKSGITATDLSKCIESEVRDRKGKLVKKKTYPALWKLSASNLKPGQEAPGAAKHVPGLVQVEIRAGDRLYGYAGNLVFAIDLPSAGEVAKVSWKTTVEGKPSRIIAADGKLFVATQEGRIYCFADKQTDPVTHSRNVSSVDGNPTWTRKVKELLEATGAREGYCVVLGAGPVIDQLILQSKLRIIAIDADAGEVNLLRQRLSRQGIYGDRVAALTGRISSLNLPPYFADLVVSESDLSQEDSIKSVFHVLRPYGGSMALATSSEEYGAFKKSAANSELPGARIRREGSWSILSREGALAGSADWTHEWADPANTLMSRDKRVKAPLGVLWYGGPSSDGSLYYDRHAWGPSLSVVGGRMFIQGPECFTATDIYTGRILWRKPIPQGVSAGRRANWRPTGFHFLAVADGIYMTLADDVCARIDPATGEEMARFTLPEGGDQWGRIRVYKDLLIVNTFQTREDGNRPAKLVAMNRHTGKTLWTKVSDLSYPVMSVGADHVFCFEGKMESLYSAGRGRDGRVPKAEATRLLKAFDVNSGKEEWVASTERVVTWLSYSDEHDVLIASNRNGIEAHRGKDGAELWRKSAIGKGFRGHPENLWDKVILWKDRIIDQRGPGLAYDIQTGKPVAWSHPISGEPVDWQFTKDGHHCGYAIASEHLMTFRAADAGFCDLASGGTSHLTGFRSGCRNSLIPAGGVLNAPNFAFGCSCSYSIFTSLALVHVPEAEQWSYGALSSPTGVVQQIGINFGAPGDRLADNGTFWLNYPAGRGASPNVPVKVVGGNVFRSHTSELDGDGLRWVAASGMEGISSATISLGGTKPQPYTVRLYFAEPEFAETKKRVFSVNLQGESVLADFDIFAETGAKDRAVMKEFTGITAGRELAVTFNAAEGKSLICGIEVIAVP